MKRLALALVAGALLAAPLAISQTAWFGTPAGHDFIISPRGGGGAPPVVYTCPASGTFLTRSDVASAVAAAPASAELTAWNADIQTLICTGNTDGWLPLLDVFYVFAAPTPAIALLNIPSATYDGVMTSVTAIPVPMMFQSSTGFTGLQQLVGNTVVTYINTEYNPGSGSGSYQWVQNSASLGACVLDERLSQTNLGAFALAARSGVGTIYSALGVGSTNSGSFNLISSAEINATSTFNSSAQTTGAMGFWHADRTASNLTTLYLNGTSVGTGATVSGAVPSSTFLIGVENFSSIKDNGYDTYAEAWLGASLGATLQATMHTDVHAFNVKRGLPQC